MFQSRRLAELEQSQALLIAKADLQRNLLQADFAHLAQRLDWTKQLQQFSTSALSSRPFLIPAAALAGFLALRGRKFFRWVPAALTAWKVIRPLLRS